MLEKIEPKNFNVYHDGTTIELNLLFLDAPVLEIINKGKKIGEIKKDSRKENLIIRGKTTEFKLTVWFKIPKITPLYFANSYGIGAELDGCPLKGTIADPDRIILKGLYALLFVDFIYLFKGVHAIRWYYYENSRSFLTSFLYSFDYVIPFLMLTFCAGTIPFNKYERSAFLVGIIFALLEFLDYSVNLKSAIETGTSFSLITAIIWITLRSNSLYMLWKGLRSSIKKRRLTVGASAPLVDR